MVIHHVHGVKITLKIMNFKIHIISCQIIICMMLTWFICTTYSHPSEKNVAKTIAPSQQKWINYNEQNTGKEKVIVPMYRNATSERDYCGIPAFECFKPVINYIDEDGSRCEWKNKFNFFDLSMTCTTFEVVIYEWMMRVVKFKYKFQKTCNLMESFDSASKKITYAFGIV